MDMSDHDNDGSSLSGTKSQADETPEQAVSKPLAEPLPKSLDAKAERAARLAAALRTNLRRRKMPGAASRPEPKDRN